MEGTLRMTITYIIASPTWGGGEQYVFDLARHMKQQFGVQTCFLFPPHSDEKMIARFETIGQCSIFRYATKLKRFLPSSGYQLAKQLDAWQTDILHINSRQTYFSAVWAKRFAHHPFRVVATQHLVRRAKKSLLWNWAYRHIDVLNCVSYCVKETYLQSLDPKNSFPKVFVVHNSVPIKKEDVSSPKPNGIPHILYQGRICREKGIEPLFGALSMIADLNFKMTFCGNIEPRFQSKWDTLLASSPAKDKINYIGFNSNMHQLLNQCHIGISPSIVREAGPLAMIENMAAGLAVITSDNGAQPEIIRNEENGILCPPNNPQDLANALRTLIKDVDLVNRLGKKAQKDFFEYYSYDRFIQEMYNIYLQA